MTAISREISYFTFPPISLGRLIIHFPPLGPVLIILGNLITVLVLCFYGLDTSDVWQWENVGYRTGFIAICQLPLIFLLAGRQNIIGYLADMSYARLNWFHRWTARTLWLTSTIHMGFWFHDWGRYDYIAHQLVHDPLTKRGFAAWCILTFIVLSSMAPVRKLSYEIFVLQHLVSFTGLIVTIWMHAPDEVKIWVWIPIGLLVFDRVARYTWGLFVNFAIFNRKDSRVGILSHVIQLAALPGNVTRVTIDNPGLSWQPGQHVFLTCHAIVPFQSHPFTIASLPSDKKMEFFVRAHNGGSKEFLRVASKNTYIPGRERMHIRKFPALIEGPYGTHRSLRQFETVVFFAGGMGATFVIPILRDIVSAWRMGQNERQLAGRKRLAATKRIRFVWAIRTGVDLSIFETQIRAIILDVNEHRSSFQGFQSKIDISIYITRDENLQASEASSELADTKEVNGPPQIELSNINIPKIFQPRNATQESIGNSGVVYRDQQCKCTVQLGEEISTDPCFCAGPLCSGRNTDSNSDISEAESTELLPTTTPSSLAILSGRPFPRAIIQKELEKAEGESAVVVCGPTSLADDIRRSVVSLSDERAVHKGTGAQGIYLHVEHFGI